MKKIVKKGYTIEVTSWENDGDNYTTKTMTVQSKEYAISVLKMCEDLFCSYNNGGCGIGNMNDNDYGEGQDIIEKYMYDKTFIEDKDPNRLLDIVMDINYDLMGSSDYYFSRVFESGCIYYSPEDIYLEEIKI